MKLDYPNSAFEQIEIDVIRSFSQIKNADRRKEQEERLCHVLKTFIKRNPKVGYF